MSTLKTNNIQHVDLADPSIIINNDGSVNIAGTMTYEDVTNVDAVGIITGRKQIHVGTGVSIAAGGLNVTAGITTVQALQAATISGTTGTFSGDIKTTAGTVNVKSGSSINTNSDTSAHGALHKNTNSGEFAVVSGGTGGNNYLSFYTAASAAPTEKVRINHSGSIQATLEGSTSNPYMLIDTSGDSVRFHAKKASGNNEFRFLTQSSGTVTERLRINTDGQLIHNVSKASGYIAEFHQDNSSNSAQILIDSPTDSNVRPTSVDFAQGGTVKWSLGQAYASSASQAFHIATSSLQTNESGSKVTIKTDGMLGIGTHNPNMTLHVLSSSDDVAKFQSTNSSNGAAISLDHVGSSPADNDIVGKIVFNGQDDAFNTTTYADIKCISSDVSNGSETAHIDFGTRGLNTFNPILRLNARGSASAPSYTTDDMNGIILDTYNTGNPYPRYFNFIAKSAGNTDSNIAFWTERVGGSPIERARITANGHLRKMGTAMFSARGQGASWNTFNSGDGWYALGDAATGATNYYIDHGWTTSGTGCGVRGLLSNGNSVWENDKARFTAPEDGFYNFEISLYIRAFNGPHTFHLHGMIGSTLLPYYTSNIGNIRDNSNSLTTNTLEYPNVHRNMNVYLSANETFQWITYTQGTSDFQTYFAYAHTSGYFIG